MLRKIKQFISASFPTSVLIVVLLMVLSYIRFQSVFAADTNVGDIDGDFDVDIFDFNQLLTDFGAASGAALRSDIDKNNKVDIFDYNLVLTNFGHMYQQVNASTFPLYMAHKEMVPDFCTNGLVPGNGSIVATIKSGNWLDPSIWSSGQVPGLGNQVNVGVQILSGNTVTYDGSPASPPNVSCIKIVENGTLKFRNDIDTKLVVGTLINYGYLEIGTEASPIQAGKNAEVVIADQPLMIDTTTPTNSKDPNQMGTGLLVLRNGKLRIHGEVKSDDPTITNGNTHAFIGLSAEPQVGDTTLKLVENVWTYKWKVGDKLVLPDSRQGTTEQQFGVASFVWQTERPTVQAISADGKTLTLSAPLQYAHPGAKDSDGKQRFLPHIGNMTRNVVIHSANPNGTRGHSLFSERADVDIRYASFNDMGRTKAAILLDNVAYNTTGQVTHIGTNQIGRYTIHFHHDSGPMRTTVQQTDPNVFQSVMIGNVIADNPKWGITIHNSHYGLYKNNLTVGSLGSGIMLEQGNEFKNVIEGNFLVDSHGAPNTLFSLDGGIRDGLNGARVKIGDFGWEGTGIWSMSPFSIFRNNVAASNKSAGFAFFLQSHDDAFLGDFNAQRPDMTVPVKNYAIKYPFTGKGTTGSILVNNQNDPGIGTGTGQEVRGADMYDPAQTTLVTTGMQRLWDFSKNESYGVSERGLHLWSGGPGTVVDAFNSWNNQYAGIQLSILDYDGRYPVAQSFKFNNIVMRGDPNSFKNQPSANWGSPGFGPFGMQLESFQYSNNLTLNNLDIQGMKVGMNAPAINMRATNVFLRNFYNFQPHLALSRFPRIIDITNLVVASIPNFSVSGQTPYDLAGTVAIAPFDIRATQGNPPRMGIGEAWLVYTKPDIIRIHGYTSNGVNIGDFRYYYPFQAPNFDIKQTSNVLQQTTDFPSITNQSAWNQYGNAIADAIAPCSNTPAGVNGFLCPLSDPSTAIGPLVTGDYEGRSSATSYYYSVNGVMNNTEITNGKYFFLDLTPYPAGNSFITVTEANIPANQQLSVLDLNKNGVVDPNERFKKTFVIYK